MGHRPATATTASTCLAGSGSASTRPRSKSRSVAGNSLEPDRMTPSNSSVKYGLPSDRANTASRSSAAGIASRMPTSCAPVWT